MTPEQARKLNVLANQLTEKLMTAAICAKEICIVARSQFDDSGRAGGQPDQAGRAAPPALPRQRPLFDEATLSVMWRGHMLHLGHTRPFRLLERLARRPNQYVTHLDLIQDVWDNKEIATATIRSAIRELRRRLHKGCMPDLASAIRGHNGRYILEL